MAYIFEHRPVRLTHILRDAPAQIARAWRRHRTERILEGLSHDQRKDIGFPTLDRPAR